LRSWGDRRADRPQSTPKGHAPTRSHSTVSLGGGVGDRDVDPLTTSFSCYVYTEDADALFVGRNAIGIPSDPATGSRLQGPPVETDHGMREFALVDPSGNLVRVGSPPFT